MQKEANFFVARLFTLLTSYSNYLELNAPVSHSLSTVSDSETSEKPQANICLLIHHDFNLKYHEKHPFHHGNISLFLIFIIHGLTKIMRRTSVISIMCRITNAIKSAHKTSFKTGFIKRSRKKLYRHSVTSF